MVAWVYSAVGEGGFYGVCRIFYSIFLQKGFSDNLQNVAKTYDLAASVVQTNTPRMDRETAGNYETGCNKCAVVVQSQIQTKQGIENQSRFSANNIIFTGLPHFLEIDKIKKLTSDNII